MTELAAGVLPRVRSLLFMPASRADMIAKIPRFAPDVAVADLEDAVPPAGKEQARQSAVAAISELGGASSSTILIRVNPVGSPWFAADVAAAAGSQAAGIVVPKLGTLAELGQVHAALAAHGRPGALIMAGIETGLGVADARVLLAGGLHGVYFGAEDYIADLGGRRSPGSREVLYARSQVSLAAHLAGIPAVDQAVTGLSDDGHFLADARDGADLGYRGKICIHPRQVELAHQIFTPTPGEVAHARAVLAAGDAGVAVVDGHMIDDVHVRMARTVLSQVPGPGSA